MSVSSYTCTVPAGIGAAARSHGAAIIDKSTGTDAAAAGSAVAACARRSAGWRPAFEAQVKARGRRPRDGGAGAGSDLRTAAGSHRIVAGERFEAPAAVDELTSISGE